MAERRTEYLAAIRQFLSRELGATDITVELRPRSHPRLRFRYRGRQWSQGICGTPSDHRAAVRKISDLRHMLRRAGALS